MKKTRDRMLAGFEALPLWVFLAVYGLTCLTAALPLAFDYRPLRILVGYFAGLGIPARFDPWSAPVFWALLLAAPLCMTLGYFLGLQGSRRWFDRTPTAPPSREPVVWLGALAFIVSAGWACLSLSMAGAFEELDSWWDYGAWVMVRWRLFDNLGYFEFTNLYVWLPLTCAWLVISVWARSGAARWVALLAILVTCGFALVLFQKKALMVTLLLILFAGCLQARRCGVADDVLRRWGRRAFASLTVVYLAMVVMPVWSESSTKVEQEVTYTSGEKSSKGDEVTSISGEKSSKDDGLGLTAATDLASLLGDERGVHVAAYALLSPFTRTSIPSFYYAEVFPEKQPFYGLDIGLDVLGLGGMPDDNLVVWAAMYPGLPGGSASAAYQFVLYSQVGLGGALLGSALMGALLAIGWTYLMTSRRSAVASSVLGALLLLFAVFLAIDSPRNSLISSYGLLWGVVMVGALSAAGLLFRRPMRPYDVPPSRMESL